MNSSDAEIIRRNTWNLSDHRSDDSKARIAELVEAAKDAGESWEVVVPLAAVTVYRDEYGDDLFFDVVLDDGERLCFTLWRDHDRAAKDAGDRSHWRTPTTTGGRRTP